MWHADRSGIGRRILPFGGRKCAGSELRARGRAGSVEIADGRSLYRVCRGEGSPTVILESGDGADGSQWNQVMTQIAEVTTVCAYDRGGLGRSDPVTGCRHLLDLTGDLAQLLEAADIPGPYVLVGTSGGGYITAGFAAAVEHEAFDDRREIGDIPVTVVTVEYENPENLDEEENIEGQQGWLILSPQAKQLVVQTDHDMANADPAFVIEEVIKVLQAARSSGGIDH